MAVGDRLRAIVQRALSLNTKAPKIPPQKPGPGYAGANGGSWGVLGERKSARTLRKFSERDVWVRTAINRRKGELSKADWAIVRLDNKNAKPNPGVVKAATELFTFVNDTKLSFEQLIAMLVEDILVIDAGCAEIERKAGGKIAALWPVPGEEIAPDPMWDGSDPGRPRYYQIRDGRIAAKYLNNELLYMMANPRSCSAVGLSPLEVLFETVEADLYGQDFEFGSLRETAPAGLLYLGSSVPPDKVKAFREEWESDIAGTREIAILGSGGFDPESGTMGEPPKFIPFRGNAKDEQRREYMRWLATKVAAAFQMDLLAFNLSESIHRSVGQNLQAKTDEGLMNLASTIERYLTREILWDIDPSHTHGFTFLNLNRRDALSKAQERKLYMEMGVTTPNEIRDEDGKLPVPWGNVPWVPAVSKSADEAKAIEDAEAENQPEDEPDTTQVEDDQEPDNS